MPFFDWFYNELTQDEREQIIRCLLWRINYSCNSYFWKRDNGSSMHPNSLSLIARSHDHEGFYDNLSACLAVFDHSKIVREITEMGINYWMGVTNGFGPEEAWNEGTGYRNSKMKWLLNATVIFDIAFPEMEFTKNPFYRTIGDFFIHLAPAGLQHSSFGNFTFLKRRQHDNRIINFRKLAYITGDAKYLKNREESLKAFSRDTFVYPFRPWVEYILPFYYPEPKSTGSGPDTYRLAANLQDGLQ